jgi:hypothetical protein
MRINEKIFSCQSRIAVVGVCEGYEVQLLSGQNLLELYAVEVSLRDWAVVALDLSLPPSTHLAHKNSVT